MIRVALVDDQTLVRSGIRGLLNLTPDIRVVAEAADGDSAMAAIAGSGAEILLLDVRMPVCSGIELLRRHQHQLPPTIFLTTFDDNEVLFAAMRGGAKGFLLKDISLERLAEGIRSVAAGQTLFRPALTERTRANYERGPSAPVRTNMRAGLTDRETEILALLAAGFNNAEIATALGPAEGTIKNHVANILSKLGVRDRMRAVLLGLELGYI
ncbi:MAG: response regulator transcription factor [Pseudomonadota bacterium]